MNAQKYFYEHRQAVPASDSLRTIINKAVPLFSAEYYGTLSRAACAGDFASRRRAVPASNTAKRRLCELFYLGAFLAY